MHSVMPRENLCFQSIGHSLIHSSSQQESLLWLLASLCFIFDKNTMCSWSGYPSMPCEFGEGRDHQPVPYSHPFLLPKAPSHNNLNPWDQPHPALLKAVCVQPDICCRFHVLYYQKKFNDRQITSQASYKYFFNTVVEALLVAQRGLFQTPRVTLCGAEMPMCGLGTKPLSEVFHFCFPLQLL